MSVRWALLPAWRFLSRNKVTSNRIYIIREEAKYLFSRDRKLTIKRVKEDALTKALVLYHSQEYGNTAAMAQAVAEGLRESGCEVDLFNTNDGRFDVSKFRQYDCAAFGSPDYYGYVAGGLKMFMDDYYIYTVHKNLKGLRDKPFVLFYSHGGGGRVKDIMPRIFGDIGTLVGQPVGSTGKPDQQVLQRCKALGGELAQTVCQ